MARLIRITVFDSVTQQTTEDGFHLSDAEVLIMDNTSDDSMSPAAQVRDLVEFWIETNTDTPPSTESLAAQ